MAFSTNPVSLGKITVATAGTAVSLTANFSANAAYTDAMTSWLVVQANPANTGVLYIGLAGMNTTSGAGVLGVIEKGKEWRFDPAVDGCLNIRPSDLRLDAATNNDWAVAYFVAR
jgi:hypothetical protein